MLLSEAILENSECPEALNYQKILLDNSRPISLRFILDVLLKFTPKHIRKKVSKCEREYIKEQTKYNYWTKSEVKKNLKRFNNVVYCTDFWQKLIDVMKDI